jgi:polyribonucleotide 5'-hydroxyl-kinase
MHNYMYGLAFVPPPGLGPMVQATPGGESALEQRLAPSSQVVPIDDITIYRIGEGTCATPSPARRISPYALTCFPAESMAPSSALPIGATRTVSELVPVRVDPAQPGARAHNALLALMAPPADEAERYDEEILDMQVAGFLAL